MIVKHDCSWLQMIFAVHGSALTKTWRRIAVMRRTIETNLLQAIGEKDIPPPMTPVDNILL